MESWYKLTVSSGMDGGVAGSSLTTIFLANVINQRFPDVYGNIAVVLNWVKQYLIGSILWRSSRAVRHGLLSHGISFLPRWNNGWRSVGDSMRTELTTGCPQGCVLFIIKINFNLSLRDKVYNKIKQKQKYSPFFVFFVCLSLYWLSAVFCTLARKMKETWIRHAYIYTLFNVDN